jgi:hypothetical protein
MKTNSPEKERFLEYHGIYRSAETPELPDSGIVHPSAAGQQIMATRRARYGDATMSPEAVKRARQQTESPKRK